LNRLAGGATVKLGQQAAIGQCRSDLGCELNPKSKIPNRSIDNRQSSIDNSGILFPPHDDDRVVRAGNLLIDPLFPRRRALNDRINTP
jgi:hypothetical protein